MNPEEHGRILLDLVRSSAPSERELERALARATEASAGAIGTERVGVWLFDDDRTRIVCSDLFLHSHAHHEAGATIEVGDAPAYFTALASERIIAADDALSDPRTRGLAAYLRANGIGALLDAPIFHAGELAGVVCHEHVGGPRIWTVEDRSFAASIGDFVGIALTEHDRRETASALERSELQFRLLAENTTDMVTDLDASGTLIYASPSHRDGIGYEPEELVGTNAFDRIHPEDAEDVVRTLQSGFDSMSSGEALFRYRHKAGHWVWVEGHGRVYRGEDGTLRAVIATRDVTKRLEAEAANRELEAQISQIQRLEGLGRLAGGLAHEFNNLLTALLGHLETAEIREAKQQPVSAELAEMDSVVRRAAGLTQQLLSLGRSQAIDPQPTDVNDAILALARMIRGVIGEGIELDTDLEADLPSVLIDSAQLDQVMMNLVINARDAMPDGGRLIIRTRSERPPLGSTQTPSDDPSHGCTRIDISDTGIGMKAEVSGRAFDPFFTTKAPGQGTGLGLSTVFQIVRQAGGTIELQSEPGEGTTFSISLPTHDAPAIETAAPAPPLGANDQLDGRERILLVEDEDYLRQPLEVALERHGYELVTARNGQEALACLAADGPGFDLVVSDVLMPTMGGVELSRVIARDHPGLKVLLMSGYAPPTEDGNEPLPGVLNKPFSAKELMAEIRALLETPTRDTRST